MQKVRNASDDDLIIVVGCAVITFVLMLVGMSM